MSALVWSVESAVLGAWGLAFSFHSSPFHAFIARSHSMIAGVNLVLQLIATARGLDIAHATSEAFVCAVTALLLVYVAALLDTTNHRRLFSMPPAGVLPLDAVFGAAWFCAAMVSATGMALSGVRHQRAALMFHQYGYHVSVVLPSLLMLWLYNYDADNTNDPVHKSISGMTGKISITHTLLFTVYVCIWAWFVAAQFLGEGYLAPRKQRSAWNDMSCGASVAYVSVAGLKFMGRCGCMLIPLSAAFSARTSAQSIMAWTLTGVAGAYAVDLLSNIEWLLGIQPTPSVNKDQNNARDSESFYDHLPPTAPVMESTEVADNQYDIVSQRDNDPAAVMLNNISSLQNTSLFLLRPPQWRREKMV
jgi:hypothetical protein